MRIAGSSCNFAWHGEAASYASWQDMKEKFFFVVLLNGAAKASSMETSKEIAVFDLAWAEGESLPALAVAMRNDDVVLLGMTSAVEASRLWASLDEVA